MKVAYFARLADTSPETAKQISNHINSQLDNRPPEGAISHREGPTNDGGLWAFNVWESDDMASRFSAEILEPTLRRFGATATEKQRLPVAWDSSHPESRP